MAVEDRNCMSLRRAARRVSNFYDAVLSPSGVRATQYSMLALLGEVGALSINDLASRLDLDRTTTGKNLQPLVTTRLVKIARSSADRRSRVASLTERGADTLRRARPLWRQAQEQFERANGKGLARDLRAMLRSIRVQR
ncbi:MAG: MarR family transcriptional regulator [Reyranella sp.]|nr:MarR family transcriptional regulator [Reyranella sp.]